MREARQRRQRPGIDVARGNGIGHLADVARGRSDAGGEQWDGKEAGQSDAHAMLLKRSVDRTSLCIRSPPAGGPGASESPRWSSAPVATRSGSHTPDADPYA